MKIVKLFVPILILMMNVKTYADDFYDTSTIQTIKITFKDTNWDYQLDTAKAGSESYIMAESITINDIKYDSVGVKYKGNSTYNSSQVKNPFHIELDTYKEQDYQGYSDIKLSNVANDPSFVREVLSYSILRNYMVAPQSNYANVYVNGTLIGLYVSSESIGKSFVKKYFGSKKNAFFKCNPIDGAGQSTGNQEKPNLYYWGTDSTSYEAAYEMNSDYGWNDLINLSYTLNNDIANIETVLDVDRALWMLAFDNVTVNLDSYIGQFAQNYYLYKADNGRFNCILWDFNEGFGKFSMSGTTSFNTTSSKSQMSHTLHSGDTYWPLVKNLLAVPSYKKRYIAHILTILEENFSSTSYKTTAQTYQSTISSSVNADPNKFYTFSQFSSNLTTDITEGRNGTTPGITNLMGARYTYLKALTDFSSTRPSITNITASNSEPLIKTSIYITAQVTNTTSSSVYLSYRSNSEDIFAKVQMYDDGAHGDGASSDNIYGASVYSSSVETQYYIYAENTNAGIFSPERAEHEFYSITASTIPSDIVINEVFSKGTSTDPDWVEIYNNSSSNIDISGYKIYDSGGNSGSKPKKEFPSGSVVAAKGFLVIVTDDDEDSGFGLSASGEKIWLENSESTVIDSVTYEAHTAENSYARIPDGGDWSLSTTVTRGYSNNESTAVNEVSISKTIDIECYPNPTKNITNFKFSLTNQGQCSLKIYNAMGSLVDILENSVLSQGDYNYTWNADNLTCGIYFYKFQYENNIISKKLILIK
ncbi:MAG: CotH kinase family protein [Paludibacter sp.]|nr:CotH kinase family protein [Paludibacter sp.]